MDWGSSPAYQVEGLHDLDGQEMVLSEFDQWAVAAALNRQNDHPRARLPQPGSRCSLSVHRGVLRCSSTSMSLSQHHDHCRRRRYRGRQSPGDHRRLLEHPDQRHPVLSAGQSTADDRGRWQRETFGGPDVHWRPMAPSAAPGSQRRSHTTATSVLATEAPRRPRSWSNTIWSGDAARGRSPFMAVVND